LEFSNLAPRRRGGAPAPLGVAEAAAGALAPVGAARPSLVAALREAWAWAWESKAASAALVALALLALAVVLQPSDASIVARALASRARVEMPALPRLVERREMADIVDVIEDGEDYVIVDGGNRVGKSVAVEVAASRLSATRTVRWSQCEDGDTAATVLRSLLGLDAPATSLSRVISGAARLSPPEPPEVRDIAKVLLVNAPGPAPVFVVEMAERLNVGELKALLDLAKVLVDKSRGRFVFVFSPTHKFRAIRSFGSLSRATVIHVGDLSESEALSFLARSGCDEALAHALYALVGGHLPHLSSAGIKGACLGTVSASDAVSRLREGIDEQLKAVDDALGGAAGAACAGLCGVATKVRPTPAVLEALVTEHLVVATLRKGVLVESRLVLAHANATCSCRGG